MRMRILWVASDAEPSRLDAVIRQLGLDGRSIVFLLLSAS